MFVHRSVCALVCAMSLFAAANSSLAVQPRFLTVTQTGTDTSQFNSLNNNGYIDVTHVHSAGGAAPADNNNTLILNKFELLFPNTGLVDGHLAQTHYANQLEVHFSLANYKITGRTIFGMWNTSDEVSWPSGPGAPFRPVYTLAVMQNNIVGPPTTFDLIGKQDNEANVLAHTELMMDPNTGYITPGPLVNSGGGVHMNAAFWKKIPTNAQEIILYGDLPGLNTLGDGIGFYFADVPEPTTALLASLAIMFLAARARRR
jgi:hypothetical protein